MKTIVVVGAQSITRQFVAAAGLPPETQFETRPHDKPKQVSAPLPSDCKAVVSLTTAAMAGQLRAMAKKHGCLYIAANGINKALSALEEHGILPISTLPVKTTAQVCKLIIFGDLQGSETHSTLRELVEANGRFRLVGVANSDGIRWIDNPECSFNAALLLSDRSVREERENFIDYLRDSETKDSTHVADTPPHRSGTFAELVSGRILDKILADLARLYNGAAHAEMFRPAPPTIVEPEPKPVVEPANTVGASDPGPMKTEEPVITRDDESEVQRQAQTPPPQGMVFNGQELYQLEGAAAAIYASESAVRKLARDGVIELTIINGEPYLTWDQVVKADGALAPLMEAQSNFCVRPQRADGLFYVDEASAYLGCADSTICRYVADGLLTVTAKDGRAFLFARTSLDDLRGRRLGLASRRRRLGPLQERKPGLGSVPAQAFGSSPATITITIDDARRQMRELVQRLQQLMGAAAVTKLTVLEDHAEAEKLEQVVTTRKETGAL